MTRPEGDFMACFSNFVFTFHDTKLNFRGIFLSLDLIGGGGAHGFNQGIKSIGGQG